MWAVGAGLEVCGWPFTFLFEDDEMKGIVMILRHLHSCDQVSGGHCLKAKPRFINFPNLGPPHRRRNIDHIDYDERWLNRGRE
jgi:hypothetical protein